MADLTAVRQHRATATTQVDIAVLRAGVHARMAGRPMSSTATTQSIQRHAEAIGRGEPTVSPAKVRTRPQG